MRGRTSSMRLALTLALAAGAATSPSARAAESIEGTWSGGGRIVLSTGDTERATCRASFRRQSDSVFAVNAVCATPSVRVSQTAVVRRVGENQYSGAFHNREYDVSGTMRLTARGGQMSVSMVGGGASGRLDLRR